MFYEFESVETFTTGAVGSPGQRVFFFQARQGGQRVAIKCEKQQVIAVSEYLRTLLSDLPPAEDRPVPSSLELAEPVEGAFVLGPIGLGYDHASDRLVVQLEELGDPDTDDEVGGGHVRVFLTRGQAVAFCERADTIVNSGRPDCNWCGLPIDPNGHACPRMN